MTSITPAEIAALVASIRARADAARPGPWTVGVEDFLDGIEVNSTDMPGLASTATRSDAEFIAHAREDVPTLLDLIETLTADLAKSEARRDLAEQTLADLGSYVTGVFNSDHIVNEASQILAEYDAAKEAMK